MAAIPVPIIGPAITALTGGSPKDVAASVTPATAVADDISGGPLTAISQAISAPLDILKLMAWIFDPKNWVRAVEFVLGIILMGFGLWAAMQAFGERRDSYVPDEDVISRSGLGRVSRALADNEGGSYKQRAKSTRRAPHVQRRVARQRGMEAATRAPKRKAAASGQKTNSLTKAIKAGAKVAK